MSVSLSNTCLRLRTASVPLKPLVLNGVVRFHLQRSSHVSSYRFGFNSNPFSRTHTPRFFKCSPQRVSDERRETQVTTEEEEEEVVEFQRLFSNLNRSTLKRESGTKLQSSFFHSRKHIWIEVWFKSQLFSGSLSSAIFLVAGTTVSLLLSHNLKRWKGTKLVTLYPFLDLGRCRDTSYSSCHTRIRFFGLCSRLHSLLGVHGDLHMLLGFSLYVSCKEWVWSLVT